MINKFLKKTASTTFSTTIKFYDYQNAVQSSCRGILYKPSETIFFVLLLTKIQQKNIIHVGTRPTDKCARILFAIFRDSFSCIVNKNPTNDREVKFKRTIRI